MSNTLPLGLPRYAVLKSRTNNQYLRYTHEDTQQHSLLQFTQTHPNSPYVKFEFEPAKIAGDFVHIKCSYNNKYLRRWNNNSHWIAAGADNPEEDRTKWSCTLFRPAVWNSAGVANPGNTGRNHVARFRHVQLNRDVEMFRGAAPFDFFLTCAGSGLLNALEVVDWDSLVFLPSPVAIKGDNGRYLSADWDGNRDYYMSFSSNDRFGATSAVHPTSNPDGTLVLRTNRIHPGPHYVRRVANSEWISWGRPNSGSIGNDRNYVFWPVRLEGANNKIALISLGNNLYCRRNTRVVRRHRMEASVRNTPWEAQFEVEERVLSRRIHDLDFRVQDARIYNQTIRTMGGNSVTNNSPHLNTSRMRIRYEDTTTRNWQATVSMTYGVTTTLSTGVPKIVEASVEVSWEITTEYTWGETHTSTDEFEVDYTVHVSPYSRMTVTMLGTQGTCDVPFSYTQTDTLRDGTTVSTRKHDGIYTGANSYNFEFENKEEKLFVLPNASAQ